MSRARAWIALAAIVLASAAGAEDPKAPARPSAPAPTLGPHAAALEGTWEFRSMKRKDGVSLAPPQATGVIVIDRGAVIAASFLHPSPERTVGTVWEGRMTLTASRFEVVPERAIGHDSSATPPVSVRAAPARSTGRIERHAGSLVFVRDDGGRVTWDSAAGRRTQEDPDGTVVVHQRTSLVPRMPDGMPAIAP